MSFLGFLFENRMIEKDIYDIATNSEYINSENIDEFICSASNITESALIMLKSNYYNVKYVPDDELLESSFVAKEIDYVALNSISAIPYGIASSSNELYVAISDPEDIVLTDSVKKIIKNYNIKFHLAKRKTIVSALNKRLVLKEKGNFIYQVISESIKNEASDIHISPYENIFEIKRRVDGELQLIKILPIKDFSNMCISMKVMAKLDISESRRPQSGHFQLDNIDFRISTQPTIYGENISIRILNKNKQSMAIDNIGFDSDQVAYLKKIAKFSHGMIIFCGPTGSGKTTSIYSMLSTIDKTTKNIMTLEDPIEYRIHGVKQTDISDGVINFATGVGSVLRQDPDVIFIGEIRDAETAHMAVRASMTGHLVFTTLHANDCIGAIKRFGDFGISPFLVADNIISIISQRLIKKKHGGRTIISEILHVDGVINNMIYNNSSRDEILNYANLKTLEQDCKDKVKKGIINGKETDKILRK
ncbi:MAG: type II/IV secretion system protein [Holosporales bacterium]|jgi:type II secretory ATPase GspE/PulE/Tfp pilus assembly ATPase PilB-like protein|nr:type II/IV secretion system protein [Holosporales bacterium]